MTISNSVIESTKLAYQSADWQKVLKTPQWSAFATTLLQEYRSNPSDTLFNLFYRGNKLFQLAEDHVSLADAKKGQLTAQHQAPIDIKHVVNLAKEMITETSVVQITPSFFQDDTVVAGRNRTEVELLFCYSVIMSNAVPANSKKDMLVELLTQDSIPVFNIEFDTNCVDAMYGRGTARKLHAMTPAVCNQSRKQTKEEVASVQDQLLGIDISDTSTYASGWVTREQNGMEAFKYYFNAIQFYPNGYVKGNTYTKSVKVGASNITLTPDGSVFPILREAGYKAASYEFAKILSGYRPKFNKKGELTINASSPVWVEPLEALSAFLVRKRNWNIKTAFEFPSTKSKPAVVVHVPPVEILQQLVNVDFVEAMYLLLYGTTGELNVGLLKSEVRALAHLLLANAGLPELFQPLMDELKPADKTPNVENLNNYQLVEIDLEDDFNDTELTDEELDELA